MNTIRRSQPFLFTLFFAFSFLFLVPNLVIAENVSIQVVFDTEELPPMPMVFEVATEKSLPGTHSVESLGFFMGNIEEQNEESTTVELLVPQEMFIPDQDRIRVYTDNCNFFDSSLIVYDFPYIGLPIVLAAGGPIVLRGGGAKRIPCKSAKYETDSGGSVSVPAGKTVKYCWNATNHEKKIGSRTVGDKTTYFKGSIMEAAKAMLTAMGVSSQEVADLCEKNRKCNTNEKGDRCRPENMNSNSHSINVAVSGANSCFSASVPAPTASNKNPDDPFFSGKVICGCH